MTSKKTIPETPVIRQLWHLFLIFEMHADSAIGGGGGCVCVKTD